MTQDRMQVIVELRDQATAALRRLRGAVNLNERAIRAWARAKALARTAMRLLRTAVIAGAAALAGFALALRKVLQLTEEQDRADNILIQQMKLKGQYTRENFRDLQQYIGALQQRVAIGDEDLQIAASRLIMMGAEEDQLKRLLKATTDYAVAMDKDVKTAALDVGKAVSGNVMMLQRLGIEIDSSRAKMEGAAYIAEVLEKNFKGTAEAAGSTLGAQLKLVSMNFGDLIQEIGKAITKNDAFQGTVKKVNEALVTLGGTIKNNKEALSDFVTEATIGILAFSETAVAAIAKIIDALQRLGIAYNWARQQMATLKEFQVKPFAVVGRVVRGVLQPEAGRQAAEHGEAEVKRYREMADEARKVIGAEGEARKKLIAEWDAQFGRITDPNITDRQIREFAKSAEDIERQLINTLKNVAPLRAMELEMQRQQRQYGRGVDAAFEGWVGGTPTLDKFKQKIADMRTDIIGSSALTATDPALYQALISGATFGDEGKSPVAGAGAGAGAGASAHIPGIGDPATVRQRAEDALASMLPILQHHQNRVRENEAKADRETRQQIAKDRSDAAQRWADEAIEINANLYREIEELGLDDLELRRLNLVRWRDDLLARTDDALAVWSVYYGRLSELEDEQRDRNLQDWKNHLEKTQTDWEDSNASLIKISEAAYNTIGDILYDSLTGKMKSAGDYAKAILNDIAREIARTAAMKLVGAESSGGGGAALAKGIAALWGGSHDSGGVIPGPLGAPRLALVHGGETVLPTHKTGGLATTVHINVGGVSITGADAERAANWTPQQIGAVAVSAVQKQLRNRNPGMINAVRQAG